MHIQFKWTQCQSAVHQSVAPTVSQFLSSFGNKMYYEVNSYGHSPHSPPCLGLTFFFGQMLLTVVANPGQIHWLKPSLCRLLTKLCCLYAARNFCLFSVSLSPPLAHSLSLCHFSFAQLKSRIMVPLQIPDTCARFPYSMLSILICMQSVKVHAQAQLEFNFSLGEDEKLLCLCCLSS